ncbi:MAG: serine hydrolase domain-containing protein [Rhizomicrobium sp.]
MRKSVLAAFAALLSLSAAFAAPLPQVAPDTVGLDADKLKLLDATMDKAVDTGEVAGIEVMAVRHGKIAELHTYGLASMAAATPIARDTIFRMYSQTKPMTGVAMMILYEKGLWKLDDPVTKFIPEFAGLKVLRADGGLEDMKRPPTMRELMTHTAGFGYGLRTGNPVDDAFRADKVLQSNGLKEMIDRIAKIPLLYQPGTKWSYSAAVDIQGYIIEKLSGQTFGQFMHEHIWGPLGMKDTGFFVPPADAARLSGVYAKNQMTGDRLYELTSAIPMIQDFTKPPSMESGGGGSVSTVDDYAAFCQMMLNKGELNGVRILKPETVALMETDQIEPGVQPSDAIGGRSIGGEALGFGLDFAITKDPAKIDSKLGAGSIWWGGAAGTWFWIDPKNDLFFLGMIQRFGTGAAGNESLSTVSQSLFYDALTDPKR